MLERKDLKGLSEEEACCSCMHGRPTGLFITASPFAFASSCQLLSCLSLCSYSWSLSSQPLSWEQGLQEQGQWHAGSSFLKCTLKATNN